MVSILALPIHLNHHARPKNHLEPVLINRDLVDQPPYQLFIIFFDHRRLLLEEDAHLGDPLAQVIPAGVFHQRLLLLIAEPVNLISALGPAPKASVRNFGNQANSELLVSFLAGAY
jgi:hypothetical protein